jgi:6-pyruvoyltetrahydropterin/6-carboxytetrahydropterin synthase
MVTVAYHTDWEAAHQLPNHSGKCRNLHGHRYELTVEVQGSVQGADGTSSEGMVMDYKDIKAAVTPMVEEFFDHHYINDTLGIITTCELQALWIFHHLREAAGLAVSCVVLKETANTYTRVTAEDYAFELIRGWLR